MADENNNSVDMNDDLDAFEAEFFQREKAPQEEDKEVAEHEDDSLATENEDEEVVEEAPEDESEDSEEEDEEEEEEKPKAKPKSKTQQRIEKLLERERLANERAAALEARLAKLEANKVEEKPKAAPTIADLPEDAPSPDAVDDKGEPLYPLGEFDPKFIRDLTKYTIEQERKADEARREEAAKQKEVEEAEQALVESWAESVEEFEAEAPDFREKVTELTEAFGGLDENYGNFLAATIMSMDMGPQVMYYLAQNIGEAQKIVASGPAAATLALGRIEARLELEAAKSEEKRNLKSVSKAPPPPNERARGAGARFTVRPDTDDLDAFEREFFKRK